MPFEVVEIKKHNSEIYLMRYDDFDPKAYLDRLTDSELERYHTFKAPKRKREFVATRILRHKLFGFEHIHYDPQGAPYIDQEGYISISHSKDLIGIALNKSFKIGLDLETHRPSVTEVAQKFLSVVEKKHYDCNDPKSLCKIWSAKEALYKLAGRKQIHFTKELVLKRDSKDDWIGHIDNYDHVLRVKLDIFEYHDTYITINKEEVLKEQHYDIRSI